MIKEARTFSWRREVPGFTEPGGKWMKK